MSIPVGVSRKTFFTLKKQLQKEQEVACLDESSYLVTLLVARHLLMEGKEVKAKILKPVRTQRCIRRGCGKNFDANQPETREQNTLRSFWMRYCPECRVDGKIHEPIVERKN